MGYSGLRSHLYIHLIEIMRALVYCTFVPARCCATNLMCVLGFDVRCARADERATRPPIVVLRHVLPWRGGKARMTDEYFVHDR